MYIFRGYIIIGDTYNHPVPGYDNSILKIDKNFNIEWSKIFGTELDDSIRDIIEIQEGGYLFCGDIYNQYTDAGYFPSLTDGWYCQEEMAPEHILLETDFIEATNWGIYLKSFNIIQ